MRSTLSPHVLVLHPICKESMYYKTRGDRASIRGLQKMAIDAFMNDVEWMDCKPQLYDWQAA